MAEERKMQLIRERFPEILTWVDKKNKGNYEDVSAKEKDFFADVFQTVLKNDKMLFSELWNHMSCCSQEMLDKNKDIEKSFDLKNHLRKHYQDCVGKNQYFEETLNQEKISYSPKVERLYSSLKYLPPEKTADYEKTAAQMLNKIVSARGPASQKLAQALENTDVLFRISEGENMDGKCVYEKLKPTDKKETLVVVLSEGCFHQHKEALGMVMCHELGHFVDRIGRPQGYNGGMQKAQEFFADALGYDMAKHCGFDLEHYKTENKKFNNPFLNERMARIQQLQTQDIARQRMAQNTDMR